MTPGELDAALNRAVGPYYALVSGGDVAARAMRDLGYDVAGADAVTADEMDAVPADDLNRLLDVARMEAYQQILANLDPALMKEAGVKDEDPKDAFARFTSLLRLQKAALADRYQYGLGTVSFGVIDRDFAAYDGTTYE